jgi:EmrB/QacA subfamily drug resistance transporter
MRAAQSDPKPDVPDVSVAGAESPGPPRKRVLRDGVDPATAAAVAYVVAIFTTAVDMHIVNVALPTLGRTFHAPIASVQWTVVAYLLTLAVVIPASGWLGDRLGTKRVFLFALGAFTFASVLCGAAQSLGELIAARAVQGVGGGMLVPVGTAMLYRAYPPERRARLARILILPVLIGPACAPILGGVLTQTLSWRWVFYVNVPIGIGTLGFCAKYLENRRDGAPGRFDVLGCVLSATGLSALIYAISEGSVRGWDSAAILGAGLAGIALLGLFAVVEMRQREPLLRLGLLRDRLFRGTNVVFGLTSGAFLGCLYLTPIFLQELHGQSPLGSGTTTFVEAIGVGVASQTLGRLYPVFGPRVMSVIGGAGIAATQAAFLLVGPGTSLWIIRGLLFTMGAFNSAVFLAVQSSMFTTISSRDTSHASAIYATQRQSSIAISVALLSTIVASDRGSPLAAFHAAYLAAAAMAAAGTVCAFLLIRTSDARRTMVRDGR